MPRYAVYAKVSGTKFLGIFEADTDDHAESLGYKSEAARICLCERCAEQIADLEVTEVTVERE